MGRRAKRVGAEDKNKELLITHWSEWMPMIGPDKTSVFTEERKIFKNIKVKGYYSNKIFKELRNNKIDPILATKNQPGLYELRVVSGESREVVYLGKANDLPTRLQTYCDNGSHQFEKIRCAIRNKRSIEVRWKNEKTLDPKDTESVLLKKFTYHWNKMEQGPGKKVTQPKFRDTAQKSSQKPQYRGKTVPGPKPAKPVKKPAGGAKNHLKPLKKFTKKATDAVKSFKKSLKQQAKNSTKKLNNSRVKKSAANVTDPLPPVKKCGNVVKNPLPPIPKCGELGQLSMAA